MKTPFDTILRLRQQELDNLRRDLVQSVQEQKDIVRAITQLSITMLREIEDHSQSSQGFSCDRYLAACRSERTDLQDRLVSVESGLVDLRDQSRALLALVHALENAAERFRHEHQRAASRREQDASDEWALTHHMRASRTGAAS